MSVIADLERMLRAAERASRKADAAWKTAAAESGERRRRLEECAARVAELQDAIAILRRDLKPRASTAPTVTTLRPIA